MMDHAALRAYIDGQIEESLTLDYKAAAALGKTDGKKREITKDVSAMANSAGGRIIYGIREYTDPTRQHLPEALDPVDRSEFTREWLEQVISNIRPRIAGLAIEAVSIPGAPNSVAYVVDIPQGTTAHQATDFKYYRRYNFESVPMHDHEVRDVMSRIQHPAIDLAFEFVSRTRRGEDDHTLHIQAINNGRVFAQYISGFLRVPASLIDEDSHMLYPADETDEGKLVLEIPFNNEHRDVVDWSTSNPLYQRPIYGPGRFIPILPGLARWIDKVDVYGAGADRAMDANDVIEWTVHADNAPVRRGSTPIRDIPQRDERLHPQ